MKPVAEDLEDLAASDMTFSIIRDAIQHHLVLTSQKGGLKVPKPRRKKTLISSGLQLFQFQFSVICLTKYPLHNILSFRSSEMWWRKVGRTLR